MLWVKHYLVKTQWQQKATRKASSGTQGHLHSSFFCLATWSIWSDRRRWLFTPFHSTFLSVKKSITKMCYLNWNTTSNIYKCHTHLLPLRANAIPKLLFDTNFQNVFLFFLLLCLTKFVLVSLRAPPWSPQEWIAFTELWRTSCFDAVHWRTNSKTF